VSQRRLAFRELSPVLVTAGLAVLLLFTPIPWPCTWRIFTGYPCPTCGMTRATRFAMHGDFASATHMHPLWFIVLPALAAVVIAETIAFVRVGRWGAVVERTWVKWAGGAIVAMLFVVWIARFFGAFGGPAPP
jgi:hypothetical protein